MEHLKAVLPDLIPLVESFLWVILIIVLVLYFRKDIRLLRDELQRRIKSGDPFQLGPLRLLERVKVVEDEVSINTQFLLSMGEAMFFNLKKLSSGNFGPYRIEESSGLERELYHLRDIDYIRVDSIRALPRSGENLSDHVQITRIGKRFVELREALPPSND